MFPYCLSFRKAWAACEQTGLLSFVIPESKPQHYHDAPAYHCYVDVPALDCTSRSRRTAALQPRSSRVGSRRSSGCPVSRQEQDEDCRFEAVSQFLVLSISQTSTRASLHRIGCGESPTCSDRNLGSRRVESATAVSSALIVTGL